MANHNPVGPRSTAEIQANYKRAVYGRRWPTSRSDRIKEVEARRRAYLGLAYLEDEIRALGLFRALDANNQITAETSRLSRDIAFVCEVDAASIASNTLGLTAVDPTAPDADALLAAASSVWQRSKIESERLRWALNLAVDGEIGLETVIRDDGKAVVISHPFEAYQIEYDDTGTTVTRLTIYGLTSPPPKVDPATGKAEPSAEPQEYRKVITPERIDVWIGGRHAPERSQANGLGVVPFSRITYRDVMDGTFALWAGYGYDDAVATVDSFVTQLRTLGTRHANPILVAIGCMVEDGTNLQEAGRTLAVATGADVKWLEAALTAVDALLKTSIEVRDRCLQTLPEFLFVDSTGNASGTALSYRALAFTAKIDPIRSKFYDALARQVGMAVAIDLSQPWDDDAQPLQIDGGPAIPQDVVTLAQVYTGLREAGAITGADLARHMQAMGIASDEMSAADYAAAAVAEAAAKAGQTAATVAKLQDLLVALQAGDAADAAGISEDAPAAAPDGQGVAEDIQATALNGAQVQAAAEIVAQVAVGSLPRESGVAMLVEFFQLDPARAERIMGPVGRTFRPAAPEGLARQSTDAPAP